MEFSSFKSLSLRSPPKMELGPTNPSDRKTTWGCHLILQPCKHDSGIMRFAVEADGEGVVPQAGEKLGK